MTRRQMGFVRSPYEGGTCINENDPAAILFDQFCTANTFQEIMGTFQQLCDLVEERPRDHEVFYQRLKTKLNSWKAQSLWSKLDKRASNTEYRKAASCRNTRVFIIGGGPCGLRVGIEVALLGGKAVVVEKRDRFSRNNVLHLWPYLIHDLKALGAKKFFGKFCAGSIDHISIRALQCILLKIALLVGVEIHPSVGFEGLETPVRCSDGTEGRGWRAKVEPADHPVSEYEFDVLIGADGKRNTLTDFRRKEFRGKLAIAITANFINRNTQAEARVEEISGVAYIFNQKFFKDLNKQTGIDLENIVYYKDDTHYFVMTAKKHSLLLKGVLLQDFEDPARLLAKDNVDQSALLSYAHEAADVSTRNMLPNLEFAHNHYGQPDVAMFDFTSMFAAEHASRVIEREGQKLLVGLVGDSLLEPFWPTGSGLARGFLGAMDAAWMIRSWASGKMTPLEVMAERESIYQLLSQTTPENVSKNFSMYTLDPNTRYPNLNPVFFKPHQVTNQYDGVDKAYLNEIVKIAELSSNRYEMIRDSHNLLKWFQKQLESYRHIVKVLDLTSSWRSGLALCALIHKYRPELIDVYSLDASKVEENCQLAFDIADQEFGIVAIVTGKDLYEGEMPDKLSFVSYLSQFYEYFRKESIRPAKIARPPPLRMKPRSPASKQSLLNKLGSRIRQRREEFEKENDSDTKRSPRQIVSKAMAKKRLHDLDQTENPSVMLKSYRKLEGLDPEEGEPKALRVRRELKALKAGVRGQNKVSVLAKDLSQKFVGRKTPPETKKVKARPLISTKTNESDLCYFCKKTVYLVERYTAEGLFFHRGCFRCEYCSTNLRIGGYAFMRSPAGEAKFYCHQHYGMKRPYRKPRKRSFGDKDTLTVAGDTKSSPTGLQIPTTPSTQDLAEVDGTDNAPGALYQTPERIEYMTESEQEESELEQTKHNLSASLLDEEDNSSSQSEAMTELELSLKLLANWSTDEDMEVFEDGDMSDGEISIIELAKSYSKKLRKSYGRQRRSKRSSGAADDDDSGSETETETRTIGASDADYESGSDTERDSDSESIFGKVTTRKRRPSAQSRQEMSGLDRSKESSNESNREKLLLSPTALKPFGYTSIYKLPAPEAKKETKPSPSSEKILKNRMAFFNAVSEPVRIDAHSFLGLRPKFPEIKPEPEPQEEATPEVVDGGEAEKEDVTPKASDTEERKVKKTKKKRRHKRGDKRRLTAEVEGSMLPGMQEAADVVIVGGSSSSGEDKISGEDEGTATGEEEENSSDETMSESTENQVDSLVDEQADMMEHVRDKVEEAWEEFLEEAQKSGESTSATEITTTEESDLLACPIVVTAEFEPSLEVTVTQVSREEEELERELEEAEKNLKTRESEQSLGPALLAKEESEESPSEEDLAVGVDIKQTSVSDQATAEQQVTLGEQLSPGDTSDDQPPISLDEPENVTAAVKDELADSSVEKDRDKASQGKVEIKVTAEPGQAQLGLEQESIEEVEPSPVHDLTRKEVEIPVGTQPSIRIDEEDSSEGKMEQLQKQLGLSQESVGEGEPSPRQELTDEKVEMQVDVKPCIRIDEEDSSIKNMKQVEEQVELSHECDEERESSETKELTGKEVEMQVSVEPCMRIDEKKDSPVNSIKQVQEESGLSQESEEVKLSATKELNDKEEEMPVIAEPCIRIDKEEDSSVSSMKEVHEQRGINQESVEKIESSPIGEPTDKDVEMQVSIQPCITIEEEENSSVSDRLSDSEQEVPTLGSVTPLSDIDKELVTTSVTELSTESSDASPMEIESIELDSAPPKDSFIEEGVDGEMPSIEVSLDEMKTLDKEETVYKEATLERNICEKEYVVENQFAATYSVTAPLLEHSRSEDGQPTTEEVIEEAVAKDVALETGKFEEDFSEELRLKSAEGGNAVEQQGSGMDGLDETLEEPLQNSVPTVPSKLPSDTFPSPPESDVQTPVSSSSGSDKDSAAYRKGSVPCSSSTDFNSISDEYLEQPPITLMSTKGRDDEESKRRSRMLASEEDITETEMDDLEEDFFEEETEKVEDDHSADLLDKGFMSSDSDVVMESEIVSQSETVVSSAPTMDLSSADSHSENNIAGTVVSDAMDSAAGSAQESKRADQAQEKEAVLEPKIESSAGECPMDITDVSNLTALAQENLMEDVSQVADLTQLAADNVTDDNRADETVLVVQSNVESSQENSVVPLSGTREKALIKEEGTKDKKLMEVEIDSTADVNVRKEASTTDQSERVSAETVESDIEVKSDSASDKVSGISTDIGSLKSDSHDRKMQEEPECDLKMDKDVGSVNLDKEAIKEHEEFSAPRNLEESQALGNLGESSAPGDLTELVQENFADLTSLDDLSVMVEVNQPPAGFQDESLTTAISENAPKIEVVEPAKNEGLVVSAGGKAPDEEKVSSSQVQQVEKPLPLLLSKTDRAKKEEELISQLERRTFAPDIFEGIDSEDISMIQEENKGSSKLERSSSGPVSKPLVEVKTSTPNNRVNLDRSSSLGSSENMGLRRKCMSKEDLQADAIKRIDDLISSLSESKDHDLDVMSDRTESRMETEEEDDYKEEFDSSQIVAFTVDEEPPGSERSFTVNEKFVNTRDRKRRKTGEKEKSPQSTESSSSFTISTPSGSVETTSSVSELHSNSHPSAVTSSKSKLVGTQQANVTGSPLEESISLERLVEINMNSSDDLLDELEIDAANLTLNSASITNKTINEEVKNNNVPSTQSPKVTLQNGSLILSPEDNAPFLSANSTLANDNDTTYYTPNTSGLEHVAPDGVNKYTVSPPSSPVPYHDNKDAISDTSDGKSLHSNKSELSASSSPYSPNRLKDAKYRFFSEAAQPVRIDPSKVFSDIPQRKNNKKINISERNGSVLASNIKNIDKSLQLNSSWKNLESGTATSPTAGIPHKDMASGESDVFFTPSTSKARPHLENGNHGGETSRKRLLPPTPQGGKNKNGITASEIRDIKEHELQMVKAEARERARLKSDEELGISGKKTGEAVKSSEIPGGPKKPISAVAGSSAAATATPSGKSDSSTLSSTDSPQRALSDGASTSDHSGASPRPNRKDKKKDKKGKKSKEDKENLDSVDGKKEKRRSFLSLLLPSRSGPDKKDKDRPKSPPPAPTTTGKSPPLFGKERPMSAPVKQVSVDKDVKLRKKAKTPAKDRIREEEEENRKSMYDEFAPLMEDISEESKKNKENLAERLELVAPPPAKAPNTALRPPKATMDEFETESEAGDDRISVRSFQAVTQSLTEEELAKMLKKQQRAVAKRQREQELKRLRMAQEIQRHLEEVEFKQRQVEERGISIERALRGEGKDAEKDESELMQEWFNVVHEKNMLVRYESELMVHARELELEDRQGRLEHQLRELMALSDGDKTPDKQEEEKKVLQELLEVVEQRDALVALLEEDRLKERKQDRNMTLIMDHTGLELSPISLVSKLRLTPPTTPTSPPPGGSHIADWDSQDR